MSEDEQLVTRLIQEAKAGYVQLSKLKQLFRSQYGRDLNKRRLKRWVTSLPGVYISDNPIKGSHWRNGPLVIRPSTYLHTTQARHRVDSLHIVSKKKDGPPHTARKTYPDPESCTSLPYQHAAVIKTLESHGGRIALEKFKTAYMTTKNTPPYPNKSVKKWILAVEGVHIKHGVVKINADKSKGSSTKNHNAEVKNDASNHQEAVINTLKSRGGKIALGKFKRIYKTVTKNIPPYPTKNTKKLILSAEGVQIKRDVVQLVISTDPETKAKKVVPKTKKQKKGLMKGGLPLRNDCYYGMANQASQVQKNCIMHFGFTSQGKKFWTGNCQNKSTRRRSHEVSKASPYSRAIVSGYIAKKIKNAGGPKAARKLRNLARLRRMYNPTPAVPTRHAQIRYNERGSTSSPIYKAEEANRNKAVVVTYLPIKRKYSDAKKSRMTIQLEVDRMSRKSDLPKSKLSSRDAYLFKLSTKAAKHEECRRRSVQKEKAYNKQCRYVPENQHTCWHPHYTKTKLREKFGTRRYPVSWGPPREYFNLTNTKKKPTGKISSAQTKKKRKDKSKKKGSRTTLGRFGG